MSAFISGLLGGIGQSMQRQREQKTLMDLQRQRQMSEMLMDMANDPNITPEQANEARARGLGLMTGQMKMKPGELEQWATDWYGKTKQIKQQAQAQEEEQRRAQALSAMSAATVAQPTPPMPSIGGIVGLTQPQEQVPAYAPATPPPPPAEAAAPVAPGGAAYAPPPNASQGDIKMGQAINQAVQIFRAQNGVKDEIAEANLARDIQRLGSLWDTLDPVQKANFMNTRQITYPPNATDTFRPVKVRNKKTGEIQDALFSNHGGIYDMNRVALSSDQWSIEEQTSDSAASRDRQLAFSSYAEDHKLDPSKLTAVQQREALAQFAMKTGRMPTTTVLQGGVPTAVPRLEGYGQTSAGLQFAPMYDANGMLIGFGSPYGGFKAPPSGAEGVRKQPLSAEQEKMVDNAKSALVSLNRMREMIKKDPKVLIKAAVPGSLGAREFNTYRKELSDVITRIRTGAALNLQEEEFYQSQMPTALDLTEPKTIEAKLKLYEDLFTRVSKIGSKVNAAPSGESPVVVPPPPTQGIPTVKSKADYDKLPSGSLYMEDGKKFKKP